MMEINAWTHGGASHLCKLGLAQSTLLSLLANSLLFGLELLFDLGHLCILTLLRRSLDSRAGSLQLGQHRLSS